MTNRILYTYALILLFSFTACQSGDMGDKTPVAKVHDKYLFQSEVSDVVPDNSTKEDSLLIADNFIRQWVKKQLLISKAELNLPDEEKDVEKLVEDYRNSLIIHKYEQILVKQKLDTLISQEEIEKYYQDYNSNFTLAKNIVKAVYIKIAKPVPSLKKVQKLYKSNKEKDWLELEDYCFQNATKFDNFNENWIYSQNLLNKIPVQIDKEEVFLTRNKYFETQDSTYHYFVKIKEFRLKNTTAPLMFVNEDIRRIILNKRKLQFIKNLEEDIYRDAEAKNKFKIY
ncbi:MAG: hypothetical protein ACEPOZ_18690 [Marinifilaceae bacterium]